jgi:hypothetical protein
MRAAAAGCDCSGAPDADDITEGFTSAGVEAVVVDVGVAEPYKKSSAVTTYHISQRLLEPEIRRSTQRHLPLSKSSRPASRSSQRHGEQPSCADI